MPWTAEDDEFISGKKPTARSPWQLFKDSFLSGALHSPAGAEGVVRRGAKLSGKTDEEINAAERRLTEQFQQRSQQDDAAFEDVDTLSPANIGRRAVELFGNILGGADPTYAINPGKSIAQKAGAQGAINAGMDAAAQVIEKRRGVRDKIDPDQIALSGAGGVVLGGGSELIARGARGRKLNLDNAVDVGNKFGRVTSTVRSAAKNKKVGGVKNSYHLSGQAIDIARGKGVTHKQIENAYRRAGFDIIESLDEGDHSHLAFNFKKSKAEKIAFKERQTRVKEKSNRMAAMDADELEAEFVRDDADIGAIVSDIRHSVEEIDGLRDALNKSYEAGEIDGPTYLKTLDSIENKASLDNVVEFPKEKTVDGRAHTARLGMVEETINRLKTTEQLIEDSQSPLIKSGSPITKGEAKQMIEDLEDAAVRYWAGGDHEAYNGVKDAIDIATRIHLKLGGTPVPSKIKGLGKGSVATTPVNDLRGPFDLTPEQLELIATRWDRAKRPSDRSKPPAAPMAPPRPGDEAAMREWEAAGNVSKSKLFGGPDDSRTPTDKLWQALNEARPLNREKKRLYSEERSKRLAKGFAARKNSSGEKGFFLEKSKLKGDMPDVDFTSIRDKFTQPEIDYLHDLIRDNPFFTGFDANNARDGLQKMLKGKLPTDSELVLLARAYPKQIIEALKKMRPWKKRVLEQVNNLVNLPRSIMSSFDISFGGRQGIFLIGRKNFWKAYSGTLKRISSEKEFQAMQREIAARPSYELMKKGGLDLMDLHSLPSEREEAFMSAWGEKLPGVRHSSRAYIGYLNRLRADMFDDLTTKFVSLGHPLDDKLLRDTARYINAATGRGNLGSFSQAATILSNVLFSPRLLASRLSLLNPAFYVSLSGPVRKEAISDLLRFSGAAASVLGLASMVPGVTVSMDTTSSDFAKIKVGNTRLDILGGFQQYIKLGFQLAKGEKTNSRGEKVEFNDPKKYAGTTYATAILDFFRSKFSPSAGYAVDAAHGKNIIGEPFDFKKDSLELFMPLWIQDVIDAVDEHGKVGALAGIPAILGVGVQTYKPRPAKEKKVNKFPSDNFDKKFKKMDLEELDKRFTH